MLPSSVADLGGSAREFAQALLIQISKLRFVRNICALVSLLVRSLFTF